MMKKWRVFVVAWVHHWIGGRGTSISHFILSKIVAMWIQDGDLITNSGFFDHPTACVQANYQIVRSRWLTHPINYKFVCPLADNEN